MNRLPSLFTRALPVLLLAAATLAGSNALAFPPAPHHELYGMVRDQWGDPIVANGAVVYIQTTNGVGIHAAIVASTEPGVNYRLDVPMDSGTAPDLYLATALRRGQPFQLKVVIGNTVFLPLEMTLGPAALGRPAEATRLDLTLGVDSDGDGLPDAWEQAIINVRGGTLASITPDGDADGDGISNLDEYLAGTYAFDPTDGFRLALVSQNSGDATLEFLAVRNRTYTVQSSTDLRQWTPVQFGVVNSGAVGALQDNYVSTDVRMLQIQVPRQAGVTNRFFKALVQ